MIDVDGTLVPVAKNSKPSPMTVEAINRASKKVHIGVATSRPLFVLKPLLDHITLSGPSIINGGSEIIEFPSEKILWEQPIRLADLKKVAAILTTLNLRFFIQDNDEDVPFSKAYKPNHPNHVWVPEISPSLEAAFTKEVLRITTISWYKIPAFEEGKCGLHIGHAAATKHHAIIEVAKILGISTHEIIGIGDGYNDFPLLMACGLKVAMGNAIDDIKGIADYIAPSVDEDGVADVIEKFVL